MNMFMQNVRPVQGRVDFEMALRQIESCLRGLKSERRLRSVELLEQAYVYWARGQQRHAKGELQALTTRLETHERWKRWKGERIPRPFDAPYMAALYWQASVALLGEGPVRPSLEIWMHPWRRK